MYGSTTADPILDIFSKLFNWKKKSPGGNGSHVGNPTLASAPVDPGEALSKPLDHVDHSILEGVQTVRNTGTVPWGYLAQPWSDL